MMNDHLQELRAIAQKNNMPLLQDHQQVIEMALSPLFEKYTQPLKMKLQQIQSADEEIKNLTSTLQGMASLQKEKSVQQRIEQLSNQTQTITFTIKQEFEKIEALIKQEVINNSEEPETRTIIYQRNVLLDSFRETILNHQQTIDDYRQKVKQKMVRQVQILDPQFAEEDADDPELLQKMIVEKTLGKAALQVQFRVQDIQDKYNDIQKLEKSVQLTLSLLNEIAFLVDSQGRDLETIEAHLKDAQTYVKKTEKNLLKEKKDHQKSRKKMCCILLISLIVLGVIATPIIMKIVKSKQG